jgi:hypothetical protein
MVCRRLGIPTGVIGRFLLKAGFLLSDRLGEHGGDVGVLNVADLFNVLGVSAMAGELNTFRIAADEASLAGTEGRPSSLATGD